MVDTKRLFRYEIQEANDFTWMIWQSDYDRIAKEGRANLLFERFKEMNIVSARDYNPRVHDGCYIPQQNQAYQKRSIGDDIKFDKPCMMVQGKDYQLLHLQEEFKPKQEKPEQNVM